MSARPILAPGAFRWRPWVSALIGLLCLAPAPAAALSGAPVASDHVTARLVSAVTGTGDLTSVSVGLAVRLDGDWKTYWRSPGVAGLPPALDWKGSQNLSAATLHYPAPQRISVLGIQTFGYKHEVVFPIDARVAQEGKPLDLKLQLDILICAEQCIPKTMNLALTVPAGPATPDADGQLLARWRAAVPADARKARLHIASAEEVSDKGKPALEVTATAEEPFVAPDLIPELLPDAELGPPRLKLSADRHTAIFDLPLGKPLPVGAHLAGRSATLTLTDGLRALESPTVPITKGASAVNEDPGPSLLAMLGIALLGGLILNLMPCVLPVLSMKVFSVVSQGGRATGAVRAGFLATAAGIVVSFLVIAVGLIAVKSAGRTIGWGLQFQEPAFIAAMAVLVTVFACHLAGLFEVPLPRFIARAAEGRAGPDESLAGHFVTGAFAALLATPCSAPFLGTAVGFALAADAPVMVAIFLALGAGLALPYLAIAVVPQLATRLPKPGAWMLRLKQFLALPLAATAVWLVGILAAQAGLLAAALVTGLLLALVALLALRDRLPAPRRRVAVPLVVLAGLAAVLLPDLIATQRATREASAGAIAWQSFDRNRIRSLVSQGKTVFVDVTADWCLTCQANKRFVLAGGTIAERLNHQAVSMQADWTRPNAEIGAYLASYGRYGIPFNIVYGPGAPSGIVLPELLTAGDVDAALDKASGGAVDGPASGLPSAASRS